MTWQEYLDAIDDSDPMTTAKGHIADLCQIVAGKEWRVLELGSHMGISTAAMAFAAPDSTIVSVDLCDTVSESKRVDYWRLMRLDNVQAVKADAWHFLRESQLHLEPWDLIFHDAVHGEAALPEYLTAAGLCSVLAIHDFEQLCPASQDSVASRFRRVVTSDDAKGRRLFVGQH